MKKRTTFMKKSCRRCRALLEKHNSGSVKYFLCSLGYVIQEKEIYRGWGKFYLPVPKEECPKPTGWDEFYELFGNNKK